MSDPTFDAVCLLARSMNSHSLQIERLEAGLDAALKLVNIALGGEDGKRPALKEAMDELENYREGAALRAREERELAEEIERWLKNHGRGVGGE